FEKVASFDPQRIEAWAGAARAHAALGQADEAEAALANGARFGADHPAVLVAREAIAQITGARPAASEPLEPITDLPSLAKAFERALSLKPNHELARKWRESCARHVPSEANE